MSKIDLILRKVGDLNFKRRVLKVLEYLNIKDGDKVLDAGCGEGFYTMVFNELYGCEIEAIDFDPGILEKASRWIKNDKKVNVTSGDICNMIFSSDSFDKVVCSEVLEHITDHDKAASELFRVIKPGGVLAVTVPNKNYPFLWDPLNKIREFLGLGHFNSKSELWGGIWAYDHKRLYSPGEITELLEKAGFKIEKVEVLTHYGLPFNHLILVLGKRFYTGLPVSKEVKSSMEKFEWRTEDEEKTSVISKILNIALGIFLKVDALNEKQFDLEKSSMAISVKAIKPE